MSATTHNIHPHVGNMPKFAPILKATELLGLSRSSIYRMAGAGELRIVKAGGRSLVDLDHAFAFRASLPTAPISPAR
jgi:excisionase family DNA binding protein